MLKQTLVILLKFSAKNPPHRQAEKRCRQCYKIKRIKDQNEIENFCNIFIRNNKFIRTSYQEKLCLFRYSEFLERLRQN